MKTPANGHSIVEYSLTLALVLAVGSIGALTGLGNSITRNFDMTENALATGMNAISPGIAAAWVSPNSSSGNYGTTWTSTGSSGGTSTATTDSVADNISLETLASQAAGDPAYAPASHIILTAGTNGATNYLASTITKQADALLANGSITQEQANQLYQLANAGHDLAKAQQALENALANGQKEVTFDGKTYNLQNFADQMTFITTSQQAIMNLDPANTNPLLTPFAQQFALVKQSDIMQNPQAAAVVNSAIIQIGALTDAISWSLSKSNTGTLEGFKSITADHFNQDMDGAPMASVTQIATEGTGTFTNGQSATLCKTGSGTDSGTNCK